MNDQELQEYYQRQLTRMLEPGRTPQMKPKTVRQMLSYMKRTEGGTYTDTPGARTIYRDGSKRAQPLNTDVSDKGAKNQPRPVRRRLADERRSITHKFDIAGHKGYVTIGLYEDGKPGEMFLVMSKEGSTISGFADAFAQAISHDLQYADRQVQSHPGRRPESRQRHPRRRPAQRAGQRHRCTTTRTRRRA